MTKKDIRVSNCKIYLSQNKYRKTGYTRSSNLSKYASASRRLSNTSLLERVCDKIAVIANQYTLTINLHKYTEVCTEKKSC